MSVTFGSRLNEVFRTRGHLCVGIDPHPYLLAEWGLPDTPSSLREFGLKIIASATSTGSVGIVKPQIAFFERHGAAGYAALEDVLTAAREAGLLVIADVKRGDVDSTVDSYGRAWLTPGSPIEVDAMTVVAYQGLGSLDGPHSFALSAGKGMFVLAATSNPEAFAVQTATLNSGPHAGFSVAASIVAGVNEWNSVESGLASAESGVASSGQGSSGLGSTGQGSTGLGSTGVVLGATVDLSAFSIDTAELAQTPILAPGFGFQGAKFSEIRSRYGDAAENVIVAASRSVLSAGAGGIFAAIDSQSTQVARAFAS
jgi:orotidine-5'-phosphate decarboxylase